MEHDGKRKVLLGEELRFTVLSIIHELTCREVTDQSLEVDPKRVMQQRSHSGRRPDSLASGESFPKLQVVSSSPSPDIGIEPH